MKLNELSLMQFLPLYMREDKTACGLAFAIEKQLQKVILSISNAQIYARIDELSEVMLDELAGQFSVTEYNSEYDTDVKRSLIKNCIQTHRQRGTVASVEKVINDVFGVGWVEEWFQYGGNPYHFKVHTSNVSVGDEKVSEFERIIASTQNIRSFLEAVIIETVTQMELCYGNYLHTAEFIYI